MKNIYELLDLVVTYLSEGVIRVFSPRDDSYPAVGFQPFTGEPYQEANGFDW